MPEGDSAGRRDVVELYGWPCRCGYSGERNCNRPCCKSKEQVTPGNFRKPVHLRNHQTGENVVAYLSDGRRAKKFCAAISKRELCCYSFSDSRVFRALFHNWGWFRQEAKSRNVNEPRIRIAQWNFAEELA